MILNILKYIHRVMWKLLKPYRLWKDYHTYKHRLSKLKDKIFSKEKIKVVFFPINIGMWKNDYLFQMMMKHPRFDPYIVSFFVPVDSWDFQLRNQKEMADFFRAKGYPYIDMYNVEKGEWLNINAFKPDVVFYTQAVDVAYPQYKIKALWKNSIFYYIPYCLNMENERAGFNTLLFNICLKVFAASQFEKDYWSSFFLNRGKNIVVTGYPSFDYLVKTRNVTKSIWKCSDHRKKVIWAPHHSIMDNDTLHYSNFLLIAEKMIDLANKYSDEVQFVFKPHPRLRPKLEQLESWGVHRTAEYYNKWGNMSNASFVDGEYYDLFMTSDALIHDCSTFMAEYLITENPVMFFVREGAFLDIHDYAKQCFNQHYVGHSMSDIEKFINDVVIGGEDPMRGSRVDFVHNTLLPKGDKSIAENIFDEIVKDLG